MIYDKDEKPGTRVMKDGGSAGVDGKIGTDVAPCVDSQGATGYQFPNVDPKTTSVPPGHPAVIPDSASVDPGDADYSVEIRYKTRQANGANLVQKGQATSPGGQFNSRCPRGQPTVLLQGRRRQSGCDGSNDGDWHTLRCTRTASGVSLYVDGVLRKRHRGAVGTIDNTYPMTIGDKSNCDVVRGRARLLRRHDRLRQDHQRLTRCPPVAAIPKLPGTPAASGRGPDAAGSSAEEMKCCFVSCSGRRWRGTSRCRPRSPALAPR